MINLHGLGESTVQITPELSVVLCTYNRAELLKISLGSLVGQTVKRNQFEVIVIDDGSEDQTKSVVDFFKDLLPVKYYFQKNAGLASARNHGIFAAQGRIIFFFDDDDVASPTLLEEHLKTHREFQDDCYAVLNYTDWHPSIKKSPLMNFVTEVGCFLFSYPLIKHGQILDYTYFWAGRSSCKRSYLVKHGVCNQIFRFSCEDIELGYRLSRQGFKIVYNSEAISYMIRPVTFDAFFQRLLKQGQSQYNFAKIYNNEEVNRYCEINNARERWEKISLVFEARVNSASVLDKFITLKDKYSIIGNDELKLLYNAYWWVFKACKLKGIIEEQQRIQEC